MEYLSGCGRLEGLNFGYHLKGFTPQLVKTPNWVSLVSWNLRCSNPDFLTIGVNPSTQYCRSIFKNRVNALRKKKYSHTHTHTHTFSHCIKDIE